MQQMTCRPPQCLLEKNKLDDASPDLAQILATVVAVKSRLNILYLKTYF